MIDAGTLTPMACELWPVHAVVHPLLARLAHSRNELPGAAIVGAEVVSTALLAVWRLWSGQIPDTGIRQRVGVGPSAWVVRL